MSKHRKNKEADTETDTYMSNDELIQYIVKLKKCEQKDKLRIAQLESKVKQHDTYKIGAKGLVENQAKQLIMYKNQSGKIDIGSYKKEINNITVEISDEIRAQLDKQEADLTQKELKELSKYAGLETQDELMSVELISNKKRKK